MEHDIVLTDEKIQFIEKLGLYYEGYSMPRLGGKIIGLLLLAEAPVSAEQISALLSASRSSISTNLRLLLHSGFIDKKTYPKDRVDYYALSADAWENVTQAHIASCRSFASIMAYGIGSAVQKENDKAHYNLERALDWIKALEDSYNNFLTIWKKRI